MTLKPAHARSSEDAAGWDGTAFSSAQHSGSSLNYPKVGYTHNVESQTFTNPTWQNLVDRAGLYFDVSPIVHKNISSATLHLRVSASTVYQYPAKAQDFDDRNYVTDHVTSCAARIGAGSDYWWTYTQMITRASGLFPGVSTGPDVSYDVTDIVKQWARGSLPNFGLVLSGESEPTDTWLGKDSRKTNFLAKMCMTQYTNDVSLEVKYTN